MEVIIQLGAIVLSLFLAMVKSLRFMPNDLSDFELDRKVKAGDPLAIAEDTRRGLLPIYRAMRNIKEFVLIALLAWLLFATHQIGWAVALNALYLLLAYLVAARGWLAGITGKFERWYEPILAKWAPRLKPIVIWLSPKYVPQDTAGIASRDELRALLASDTRLLAPQDKARLLGAFDFGSLLVADAMVPRDKIVTVDVKETAGPVLLDRLHKDSHNIFVAVDKTLDHIKGLLYMADLTPLDPEIKDVADAIRPTVHYLPVDAGLQDVLAASLQTGRQLFIAVDNEGKTKGLITLADALAHLNGEPLPKEAPVSTKPEIG